jgi:hypothetical protein
MSYLAALVARSCLTLSIVAVLLARPLPVFGAEPGTEAPVRPRTATIATSLVTPFFDAYYLEGKIRAPGGFAAVVNTSYLSISRGDWTTRAGTIGVGADYFFQGEALRRWYVEAIAELWLVSPRHAPSGAVAGFAPGYAGVALVGYQLVFDRGPMIDVGIGVVAFHLPGATVETASGSVSSQATTTVYPAGKLNVGWAF